MRQDLIAIPAVRQIRPGLQLIIADTDKVTSGKKPAGRMPQHHRHTRPQHGDHLPVQRSAADKITWR